MNSAVLYGNHRLGKAALLSLLAHRYTVWLVSSDTDNECYRTAVAAGGVHTIPADNVTADARFPAAPDLVVSAHSYVIIPAALLERVRCAAFGYHPSLLPAYRGRNAIRDALRAGTAVTGGTVYRLTPVIDGGPAVVADGRVLQGRVRILPGETPRQLWDRALEPLGACLLEEAVAWFSGAGGQLNRG